MRGRDDPGMESGEAGLLGAALLVEEISGYYSFTGAVFCPHRRYGALHDNHNDKTNPART
jgi:hypothetical protein